MLILSLGIVSCTKKEDTTIPDPDVTVRFQDLVVSPDFRFETTVEKSFRISTRDNLNKPIPAVRFDLYTAHPDSGGILMTSGATNADGIFSGRITIPAYLGQIVVTTRFLGIPAESYAPVSGDLIEVSYGGQQKSLNVKSSHGGFKSSLKSSAGVPLNFLGTFNNQGVPNYLEPVNDPISADLLDDVNASLPERRPVPDYNPEYLDSDNQTSLTITQESDVWLTFVHEGAGNTNTLGFYTYDVNNPPASVNDISAITVIYPNVSFAGSGGGLVSGNKVLLGRFPADTKIGWALLQNGFSGGNVNPNALTFFSDSWLNPESNSTQKQHTVMLLDPGRDIVLMGFEDLRRDLSSCDNDFNDAIFYVTANPVEAIQYSAMPLITYNNPDTDGDGIPDTFDDFPSDPEKAFVSYFPGETTYGTLGFEDLWPSNGDYDFNDLVVKYRFAQVTNGNNEVVQINPIFIPEAMGASLNLGFGFQLPMTPSGAVEQVTGSELTEDYITLAASGVESGQSKAVFIAFDNALKTFSNVTGQNPAGMAGINTSNGGRTATPDTIRMTIDFVNALNAAALGQAPYNPFIMVGSERGHEIHLPDFQPTDKANPAYFGTYNDDSQPATGRYYKSENNLPWGMNIVDSYDHTVEKEQIISAYCYFGSWAVSSGVSNKDWFKNYTGYRIASKIFQNQ